MRIVISEAKAAARLFIKESAKACGADGILQDSEKRAAYAKDKEVVGKALYRFEDAMFQSHWGGNDALTKVTADMYERAALEGVEQLEAIDNYEAHGEQIGNGDGVVTDKEANAYPRTKNHLPIMAQTLVDFMVAAKKDGRL